MFYAIWLGTFFANSMDRMHATNFSSLATEVIPQYRGVDRGKIVHSPNLASGTCIAVLTSRTNGRDVLWRDIWHLVILNLVECVLESPHV